jgi:hypothetical protein
VSQWFKHILVVLLALVAGGCAGMPDFQRMQNTMDAMAYSTGLMAANMPHMVHSTTRMAAVAERAERRSYTMIDDLQKGRGSMERSVQNYVQSFLDNDRAMISNLKAIAKELGELRQSIRQSGASVQPDAEQPRVNARLQARLDQLETRLAEMSAQIAERNKKIPQKQ